MLAIEGLTKKFDSVVAVADIDMEVRSGEIHGLIGPNGAGKTTTINLITGELQPTSGAIRFRDEDLVGLSPSTIARRGIGRSFQVVQFFPEMTVREHLHLALRDPSKTARSIFGTDENYTDSIESIASVVHLGDRLDIIAKKLSHGEKRFLDVGVVLGLDSDVILFDEPAAGLNTSETEEFRDIIENLRGEYTILLIEHDIELVRSVVDRITVLQNGEVLATGPPSEIVNNSEVKEVYLGE